MIDGKLACKIGKHHSPFKGFPRLLCIYMVDRIGMLLSLEAESTVFEICHTTFANNIRFFATVGIGIWQRGIYLAKLENLINGEVRKPFQNLHCHTDPEDCLLCKPEHWAGHYKPPWCAHFRGALHEPQKSMIAMSRT